MHARPPSRHASEHTAARTPRTPRAPNPFLPAAHPSPLTPAPAPTPTPTPTPSPAPLTGPRVWRREEEDIRLATMPFLTAENDVRTAFLMEKVKANTLTLTLTLTSTLTLALTLIPNPTLTLTLTLTLIPNP